MSQTTPRKNHSHAHAHAHAHAYSQHPEYQQQQQQFHQGHHTRNRSQQLRAQAAEELHLGSTSDYESDTARYMASHPPPPPASLAARTNTELNLKVLRRYRPGITSILSIAANAVVYIFESKWEKSNLEGTLFICAQGSNSPFSSPSSSPEERGAGADNGCLFILNRKGLQNLVLDLREVSDFELANTLLIFNLDEETSTPIPVEAGEPVRPKVLGMWMYAEDDQDRLTNESLIRELWSKARAATLLETETDEESSAEPSTSTSSPGEDVGIAPTIQGTGRQVSLNELFGRSSLNGFGGGQRA
ncbi:PH domain-like protein [Hypoxylon crocopeplum]|nr:PH domain-like protein [Hypoxylon crocopeplum]